jgi:hypothetical protein
MTEKIVVGSSESREFGLRDDGDALVGTGFTIGLYLGPNVENHASALNLWVASTAYALGDIVWPTTANGRIYRCTTAGTSGTSEPTFPTTPAATVVDGTVTWTESSPVVAWLSQAGGTVTVSGIEMLPVGGYRVRYSLTDGASKVGYAPTGDAPADLWQIVKKLGGR